MASVCVQRNRSEHTWRAQRTATACHCVVQQAVQCALLRRTAANACVEQLDELQVRHSSGVQVHMPRRKLVQHAKRVRERLQPMRCVSCALTRQCDALGAVELQQTRTSSCSSSAQKCRHALAAASARYRPLSDASCFCVSSDATSRTRELPRTSSKWQRGRATTRHADPPPRSYMLMSCVRPEEAAELQTTTTSGACAVSSVSVFGYAACSTLCDRKSPAA